MHGANINFDGEILDFNSIIKSLLQATELKQSSDVDSSS